MFNANLYVLFDLTLADKDKINDAISVMQDVIDGVSKCKGEYEGSLKEAIEELRSVMYGDRIY